MEQFDFFTLRREPCGDVAVIGWGEYPASSVLAGQTMLVWLDSFPTEDEARKAYPQAEGFSSKWTEPRACVSHLPDEGDY